MSKPKLALIPSGYKSGKVYSILPNDATGDFDFDRASEGTRVRKDGLIEEVTNDVPRLDWLNSNCPSLLLEPQQTNLQVYSEQFDNSSVWSRARGTAIADQQISPNGEYTADKILGDGTGTTYFYDGISFTSGLEYAISIFVKPINVTTFTIQNFTEFGTATFDIQNGTSSGVSGSLISQNIQNYGNGWYRCSAIYDCTSTGSKNIGYGIQNYDGDQFYLWGAQVEQGSYPTSYIKTEASTVTRLKDECINGGDSDLFDITEGTFFVDVTPYKSDSSFTAISLNDDSSNNRVEMFFYGGTNQVRFVLAGGGGGLSLDNYETITYNTRNKMAVTFNGSTAKVYLNSSLEHTDTSVDAMVGLDRLEFTLFNGTLNFEGKVHDTRVYDRVLTEEEAIELTTI
ncbi:MAG: phage head spike fiber domain-containing protein [Vampirovibrionia bacterium]